MKLQVRTGDIGFVILISAGSSAADLKQVIVSQYSRLFRDDIPCVKWLLDVIVTILMPSFTCTTFFRQMMLLL